jgi:(E)-4-hydroxy-3-methylbut-2-enyl-diphosphate synthase
MGCVVNGPGEAREADFGIAGGKGRGIVFAHGKVVRTCREDELVEALLREIGGP